MRKLCPRNDVHCVRYKKWTKYSGKPTTWSGIFKNGLEREIRDVEYSIFLKWPEEKQPCKSLRYNILVKLTGEHLKATYIAHSFLEVARMLRCARLLPLSSHNHVWFWETRENTHIIVLWRNSANYFFIFFIDVYRSLARHL